MKVIHHTYIFILCSLVFNSCWGQNNYLPGYVVLNNQDTIYGKVQDRNVRNGTLFRKIRFIPEGSKRRKKYSPYDILAYQVENTLFVSKWFHEDNAFFRFQYTSRYGLGEKVFLRMNATGKLNCYTKEFVHDDNDYWDGFELFQRAGEAYMQRANQGIFGLKKKQLNLYFSDCPLLLEKMNENKIRRATELAEFYNSNCE